MQPPEIIIHDLQPLTEIDVRAEITQLVIDSGGDAKRGGNRAWQSVAHHKIQDVLFEQGPVRSGIDRVFQKRLYGFFHAIQVILVVPNPVLSRGAEGCALHVEVLGPPFVHFALGVGALGRGRELPGHEHLAHGPDVPSPLALDFHLIWEKAHAIVDQHDLGLVGLGIRFKFQPE